MEILVLVGAAFLIWFILPFLKRTRHVHRQDNHQATTVVAEPRRHASSTKIYTLKTPGLTSMHQRSTKEFTYEVEYQAAVARQRIWIQYEDKSGNITERKIEIYHPEDDDYVFAWCCSRQEPRTFSRWNIRAWQLLSERFEADPIVERYWREEGTRDMEERVPWRRWIAGLGNEVAARYEGLREHGSTCEPRTRPPISKEMREIETRWWELRDQALLAYSSISSTSLADYQEVIRLAVASINGGASVSAQARLYRVLGEIYQHCGCTTEAIEHLERAIRLDPGRGVKKLLARLKADLPT